MNLAIYVYILSLDRSAINISIGSSEIKEMSFKNCSRKSLYSEHVHNRWDLSSTWPDNSGIIDGICPQRG